MGISEIFETIFQAATATFPSYEKSILEAQLLDHSFKLTELSDSSLKLVEFCMELEEALDITLEVGDLLYTPTVSDFATLLLEKVNAKA